MYEKELENLDEALSALARHRRPLFRISFSKKRRALLKQSKLAREALALDKSEKLRFIRSRKGDVGKAVEFLLLRVKMYRDYRIPQMMRNASEFQAQDSWGSCYWLNKDLQGRPIFVIRVCRHNPKIFSTEATGRYVLWKTLSFLNERPKTRSVTVIVDFMFASRKNLDMRLIKNAIPMLQKLFPERLGQCIVYPSSLFVWMLWKAASVFVDDRTVEKIVFMREKKKTKFLRFIAKDKLQRRFGGTCDADYGEPPSDIGGGRRGDDEDDGVPFDVTSEEYEKFLRSHEKKMETTRRTLRIKSRKTMSLSQRVNRVGEDSGADETSSAHDCGDASTGDEEVELVAGLSLNKIPFTENLPEVDAPSWSVCDPKTWRVRCGPNYRKNKYKAFSKSPPLYNMVAVDVFRCEQKVENFAKYLRIGSSIASRDPNLAEIMIITLLAPHYEHSLFKKREDGPGSITVLYLRLSDWAVKHPTHPSVKLMSRFQNCHDSDPFRNRFKMIARTMNLQDLGLGRIERTIASKYNATPLLTRPQHCFYKGDGYFEIDIDVHRFNYLCRRTGHQQLKKFPKYIIELGFVIQAESDVEMPERMLGCCRLYKVDYFNAPELDPVLTRPTSPKLSTNSKQVAFFRLSSSKFDTADTANVLDRKGTGLANYTTAVEDEGADKTEGSDEFFDCAGEMAET